VIGKRPGLKRPQFLDGGVAQQQLPPSISLPAHGVDAALVRLSAHINATERFYQELTLRHARLEQQYNELERYALDLEEEVSNFEDERAAREAEELPAQLEKLGA